MIRSVAETTNFNFEDIFRLSALEFFGYLKYINERARRQIIEQKKMEAQARAGRRILR